MRLFSLLLLASSAVAAATAPDRTVRVSDDVEYVIPAGSPVTYRRTGEFYTVYYNGELRLTGNYSYGYVTDDPQDDGTYGDLELSFTIVEQDARQLPYWSRDHPPREIYIRNPDRFAQQVIGRTDIARLRAKEIKRVSGTATIHARNLQTTIDCDQQSTSVEFVFWQNVKNRRVASMLADQPGC